MTQLQMKASVENSWGSFVHLLMMNIVVRKFLLLDQKWWRHVWHGAPTKPYTRCFTLLVQSLDGTTSYVCWLTSNEGATSSLPACCNCCCHSSVTINGYSCRHDDQWLCLGWCHVAASCSGAWPDVWCACHHLLPLPTRRRLCDRSVILSVIL